MYALWTAFLSGFTLLAQLLATVAPDPWSTVLSVLDKFGVVGVLVVAVVALVREDIVPGRRYRAVLAEREQWKRLAMHGTALAGDAVAAAETAVVAGQGE